MEKPKPHPAKYSNALMSYLEYELDGYIRILDPMAGVGKLRTIRPDAYLNELEWEWLIQAPPGTDGAEMVVGNALALPWPDGFFDAVVTSPCLTPDQRILTSDLRWLPAGDIQVGDRLIAFEEFGSRIKPGGQSARRQLEIATVTESYPAKKFCVRVNLANGESVTCTHDHPWLATRYADNSKGAEWVSAENLMKLYDPHVLKQFDTWKPKETYRAGWLAGILDGEGSLSYGIHGSPKLMMAQAAGKVLDQFQAWMIAEGYSVTCYSKGDKPVNLPVFTVYANGGFSNLFKILGEIRPTRLLGKIESLGMKGRAIHPEKVRVISVELIGERDIQGITTSTGTYIGEGYLHHNTYGNRMADHHNAKDGSKRNTYRHTLGRELSPQNSGSLQWGAEYRRFHYKAWKEVRRVLRDDGRFVLNIKDHIRKGKIISVTHFHLLLPIIMGFDLVKEYQVATPGLREGENHEARISHESILVFRKDSQTLKPYFHLTAELERLWPDLKDFPDGNDPFPEHPISGQE